MHLPKTHSNQSPAWKAHRQTAIVQTEPNNTPTATGGLRGARPLSRRQKLKARRATSAQTAHRFPPRANPAPRKHTNNKHDNGGDIVPPEWVWSGDDAATMARDRSGALPSSFIFRSR